MKDADDTKGPPASSPSNGLPEFHVAIFKYLVSIKASVRETTVETMVMELQEVQKRYDKLGKKELVDYRLQLEIEKDDGLNNCAPSLRCAVRRIIHGAHPQGSVQDKPRSDTYKSQPCQLFWTWLKIYLLEALLSHAFEATGNVDSNSIVGCYV